MIEKIKGITITGRKFATTQKLEFFQSTNAGDKPERLALVYGRNGTGKTTIASAFRQVNPATRDERITVSLVQDDDTTILLPNETELPRTMIRVFDERYVDDKIKLLPDRTGLGSIVLFKDPGDLKQKLKELDTKKTAAKQTRDKIQDEITELRDSSKPNSPESLYEDVKNILRASWAEKDQLLRGNPTKSRVTDPIVERLAKLVCQTAEEDIEAERTQTKSSLDALANAGEVGNVPALAHFAAGSFKDEDVIGLLNTRMIKPELTDREKQIMALLEDQTKSGRVEEIHKTFSEAIDHCPYCFRPIDANERGILTTSVEKVLNHVVDEHKAKLAAIASPTFTYNAALYTDIDKSLSNQIATQVDELNAIVQKYHNDIQEKISNPFLTKVFVSYKLEDAITTANALVDQLETKRMNLVTLAQSKAEFNKTLFRLCDEEAHYQIDAKYKIYLQQTARLKNDEENLLPKAEDALRKIEKEFDAVNTAQKGIGLAVPCINKSLSYIYGSPSRFSVDTKGGNYVLKSHGFDIKPSDVSTGERHALALAYFFVDIMENLPLDQFYTKEMLLVIDDPVSSFDSENKVGVFSFLMRQFENVLTGNVNSRIILLTHDVYTMIQMSKSCSTLMNEIMHGPKIRQLSLGASGAFSEFNPGKHNEYSALLWDVYDFAKSGQVGTCAFAIGNEIRRVLEAYSTFLYRKDFLALFYDADARQKLGKFYEHFSSRMVRSVLNGESHLKFQAQAFTSDGNFFTEISDADRQNVARDVLCLLFILNAKHLEAHLGNHPNDKNALKTVESWKTNIEATLSNPTDHEDTTVSQS